MSAEEGRTGQAGALVAFCESKSKRYIMVRITKGAIVKVDVALMEYLKHLDKQERSFIAEVLDHQHLLIKTQGGDEGRPVDEPNYIYLQQKIEQWHDAHSYDDDADAEAVGDRSGEAFDDDDDMWED